MTKGSVGLIARFFLPWEIWRNLKALEDALRQAVGLVGSKQHRLTAGRSNLFQQVTVGRTHCVDIRANSILLAQLVVFLMGNRINHAARDHALLRHRQDGLEVSIQKAPLNHIVIPDLLESKSEHLLQHPPLPSKNTCFN